MNGIKKSEFKIKLEIKISNIHYKSQTLALCSTYLPQNELREM